MKNVLIIYSLYSKINLYYIYNFNTNNVILPLFIKIIWLKIDKVLKITDILYNFELIGILNINKSLNMCT